MAKRDIWVFSATEKLEGELILKTGNNLKQVTGIEKLVNMFSVMFLTAFGSDITYPSEGTLLSQMIGGNSFKILNKALVLASLQDAVKIVKSEQDTTTPSDESLDTIELLDLFIEADTISIKVALTSDAGELRIIVFPSELAL